MSSLIAGRSTTSQLCAKSSIPQNWKTGRDTPWLSQMYTRKQSMVEEKGKVVDKIWLCVIG